MKGLEKEWNFKKKFKPSSESSEGVVLWFTSMLASSTWPWSISRASHFGRNLPNFKRKRTQRTQVSLVIDRPGPTEISNFRLRIIYLSRGGSLVVCGIIMLLNHHTYHCQRRSHVKKTYASVAKVTEALDVFKEEALEVPELLKNTCRNPSETSERKSFSERFAPIFPRITAPCGLSAFWPPLRWLRRPFWEWSTLGPCRLVSFWNLRICNIWSYEKHEIFRGNEAFLAVQVFGLLFSPFHYVIGIFNFFFAMVIALVDGEPSWFAKCCNCPGGLFNAFPCLAELPGRSLLHFYVSHLNF